MAQEMGESRDEWGRNVIKMVENFCDNMKKESRPFYIVYACKPDKGRHGCFVQTIKAYYQRPPLILGVLVWYVDNRIGELSFVPELSCPPDVPLDPSLLSDKAGDASVSLMEKGQKMKVLVS